MKEEMMRAFLFVLRKNCPGLLVVGALAVLLLSWEIWKERETQGGNTHTAQNARSLETYDKTVRQTAVQVVVARYLFGRSSYTVNYTSDFHVYLARVDHPACLKESCVVDPLVAQQRLEAMTVARAMVGDSSPAVRTSLGYRCAERIVGANVPLVQWTSRALRAHLEDRVPFPTLPAPEMFAPSIKDADLASFCTRIDP